MVQLLLFIGCLAIFNFVVFIVLSPVEMFMNWLFSKSTRESGLFEESEEERIYNKMVFNPKKATWLFIVKGVISTNLFSLLLFTVTYNLAYELEGDLLWFAIIAILYSLSFMRFSNQLVFLYFTNTVVSLILMFYGFSILAPMILAPVSLVVSALINVPNSSDYINRVFNT